MTAKWQTLTISRKRWLRGGKGGESLLRNKKGQMCCLGFYARQCGIRAKQITNVDTPISLVHSASFLPDGRSERLESLLSLNASKGHYDNSPACKQLMHTNDTHMLSERKRESELRQLFRLIRVRVKFTE